MSGLEALAILTVLAPALKTSFEYIQAIRQRRRRRRKEIAVYEEQLEKSLSKGEYEIRAVFQGYADQLGDAFRRGDDIFNQRISLQIIEAQNMQRILSLSKEHGQDIQNISDLWYSAETIPRQTKTIMGDLSARIVRLMLAPPAGPPTSAEPYRQYSGDPTGASTMPVGSPSHAMAATQSSAQHVLTLSSPCIAETSFKDHIDIAPRNHGPLMRNASSPEQQRVVSPLKHHRESFASLDSSNTRDSRTSSMLAQSSITQVRGGFICSDGPRKKLVGGPNKKNGFHGFCEGAWKTMSDPKKYMPPVQRPFGLTGKVMVLECKKCPFRGLPVKDPDSKAYVINSKIETADCGIQYRFSFLAKSHQKCVEAAAYTSINAKMNANKYGCLFCYAEGWQTDTFGGVESLMNHIYQNHSQGQITGVQQFTSCIWARKADNTENFDINIPNAASPVLGMGDVVFDLDKDFEQNLSQFKPLEPERSSLALTDLSSLNELPASEEDYYSLSGATISGPVELDGQFLQRLTQI